MNDVFVIESHAQGYRRYILRLHCMIKKLLVIIPFTLSITAMPVHAMSPFITVFNTAYDRSHKEELLGSQQMNLNNRYADSFVNDVFRDNILLNLAYLSGDVTAANDINWDTIRKPSTYEFTLKPGEVFAFHDAIKPEYEARTVITTNSHFNATDGYLSSGSLYGDGVCHFASLINWAAHDAGLHVVSPVNHNFATIPGVPREYGTSIYYEPNVLEIGMSQNLYIENTYDTPVKFVFASDGDSLTVSVYK